MIVEDGSGKADAESLASVECANAFYQARSAVTCTLPPCGAPTTTVHHEDHVCTIMDCEACTHNVGHPVPMVALRRHDSPGTDAERAHMRRTLKSLFPARTIDENMRWCAGHAHMHARRPK